MQFMYTTTRVKYLFVLTAIVFGLSTCDQQQQEKIKKRVEDLRIYVTNHRDSIDRYMDVRWDSLDNGFSAKKVELEKDTARMDQDTRQTYYNAISDWESFRADYSRRMSQEEKLHSMDALRNSLTMPGVRTDYTDLDKGNIRQEYEYFVNTVKANKDTYTKEQWTVVNVSYKTLNGRNRELQKDISSADGAKIVKLQLEYTGIKALNRPFADNP